MEPSFVATRVTNPSKGTKKGVKRMARKRPARDSKGRFVRSSRKRNPSRKSGSKAIAKRSYSKKRAVTRRRRNPDLAVGGVKVKPAVIQGLGIAAGAFVGQRVTDWVGKNIIGMLPDTMQTIGYLGGAVGTLMLGEYLQKKVKEIPVTAAMAAISVPMWIRIFQLTNIIQAPVGAVAVPTEGAAATIQGLWPFGRRKMRGSLQPGRIPGSNPMSGTIQPGRIPGGMTGMGARGRRGGFGSLLS